MIQSLLRCWFHLHSVDPLGLVHGIFIHGVSHVKHLLTLLARRHSCDILARDAIDVVLPFLHAVHVFFEAEMFISRFERVEPQQLSSLKLHAFNKPFVKLLPVILQLGNLSEHFQVLRHIVLLDHAQDLVLQQSLGHDVRLCCLLFVQPGPFIQQSHILGRQDLVDDDECSLDREVLQLVQVLNGSRILQQPQLPNSVVRMSRLFLNLGVVCNPFDTPVGALVVLQKVWQRGVAQSHAHVGRCTTWNNPKTCKGWFGAKRSKYKFCSSVQKVPTRSLRTFLRFLSICCSPLFHPSSCCCS